MQLGIKSLAIQDATLRVLIQELGEECSRVLELIAQLQLSGLRESQKADILAELTAATLHLHTHCDDDLQGRLAEELEQVGDGE